MVPEIWVEGKKVEGAATCKELKLPSGRRCEMREVQQGWLDPRTVVYIDSKQYGPVTSCNELLLAAGQTCEAKETRPPKMAAQLFVDGRPRGPIASCSEVNVKPGQACDENLASVPAEWYEGREGQLLGLAMLGVLAVLCYFLASLGAKWALRATPPAEEKPKEEAKT
jgi:hypothetical protein